MKTIFFRVALVLVSASFPAFAQLGNVWHVPAETRPSGVYSAGMRDPLNPPASALVTFYQGVNKSGGDNQTGGTLHYRLGGGTWQSAALGFHTNETGTSVQIWKSSVSMPATTGTVVDYYFAPTFSTPVTSPTYIYNSGGTATTATQSTAQANPFSFTVSPPRPVFTVNGTNGDYSKSNFYIDENNDTSSPSLQIRLNPGIAAQVEVFTNLNNRDRANDDFNNDGIEDGILPPDGNLTTTAHTGAYFRAYAMTDSNNDGTYELDLPVLKTGAYRVTARYRASSTDPWIWLGNSGIRDHAVVVAPKIARDMRVYELHVANANATAASFSGRGTFEDLHDPAKRVNIAWLQNLGVNWIWFQPFHPQGLDGRQTDPTTNSLYDPGSPYSIRNFWEINPLYTRSYDGSLSDPVGNPANYAAAMAAFKNFASAADQGGIQLMLDFPFNHTAPDVVLGQKGVEIFGSSSNWQPSDKIRDRVPGFFSTDGNGGAAAYSAPAQTASQIATAPDRNDFGKWSDVRDVFFGNYATLVTGNPSAETSRAVTRNEADWMDFGGMSATTRGVWRYFGEVLPHWIIQSGHRGYNSTSSDGAARDALDAVGIDGLRKDFGQGLPPQAMEYIINRTHELKWNFVFMTESLDGEQVTYRSSRHFAVLNENIVFPLQAATTTSAYRSIMEGRRNSYGQSLVLLNNTSHDELPYSDPWQALIRYTTVSTTDGAPMLMYGQEIGAGQKTQNSAPQGGFDWYEENFGKFIPNFKKWNSMQPQWSAYDINASGVQFLPPAYAAVGQARASSPALRSSNRWFLNPRTSNDPDPEIFAVAKYTSANTPLARQEVVLAFTSLDRNSAQDNTFGLPSALADILGLQAGRTYNAKNIAAYAGRDNEQSNRRAQWLWGTGFTRSQIEANGIYVSLNPVPIADATWSTAPFEAKYLKLYDVTPPPSVTGTPTISSSITANGTTTVSWSAVTDPEGPTPTYRVTASNGSTVETTSTSVSFQGLPPGTYTFTVTALNPNDPSKTSVASTSSPSVRSLTASGDEDNDGQNNADELIAGTDPLNPSSRFAIKTIEASPGGFTLTWTPVPGKTYTVEACEDLSIGDWLPIPNATGLTNGTYTDSVISPLRKFYRLKVQ
jgi:hypothetical protein